MEESMYGTNHLCEIIRDYIIKSPPTDKVFANWRLRYFVLYDGKSKTKENKTKVVEESGDEKREVTLKYFENETAYESGGLPYGIINIKFAHIRKMKEKVHGYRFVLELITPSRLYYLCFTSDHLCNKWFDQMSQLHQEVWIDEGRNDLNKEDRADSTDTISQDSDSGFLGCHTDSNASSLSSNTEKRHSIEVAQQKQDNRPPQLQLHPHLPSKRLSAVEQIKERTLGYSCYSNSMDSINTLGRSSPSFSLQPFRRDRNFSSGDAETARKLSNGLQTKPAPIPRNLNTLKDFVDDLEKRRPVSPMSPVQKDMLSRLVQQKQANIKRTPSMVSQFRGPMPSQSLSTSLQNLAI